MADADKAHRPAGISVVIPTYNRDAVLLRAVASVVTRRPQQAEIIVVDDGSTSNPLPLLPSHNDSGVPVRGYRFSRNRGAQAARNLGLRRAHFSHVAFLDSDDVFLPAKLDRVFDRLAQGRVDLLFHGVQGMERYGRLARLWQRQLRPMLPFHWLLALLNPVPTPSLVVRRRQRLGPPGLRHSEDWAFLLRYVSPGLSVVYLDAPLAAVSRPPGAPGGLSGAAWRMRRGEFSARRMLLRSGGTADRLRFALGSLVGVLRVLADLLRGRYWR